MIVPDTDMMLSFCFAYHDKGTSFYYNEIYRGIIMDTAQLKTKLKKMGFNDRFIFFYYYIRPYIKRKDSEE